MFANKQINKVAISKQKKQHYQDTATKRKGKFQNYYIQKKLKTKNDISLKLQDFFEEIKDGPIYPCVCCCRNMFKKGVKIVKDNFKQQLEESSLISCVKLDNELMVDNIHYVCVNCHLTLSKKKKMPAICFQNGLGLSDVPDCLKLTDLENQLVAKSLIFLKIWPSPRSNYDKMVNRVVNVPLPDDEIIKTVNSLPRQSDSNGLIKVKLKRKLEYKTSVKDQKPKEKRPS